MVAELEVKPVFKPSAKVIADSVNPDGDRLTTFVCTYHRFIHAEVLTHRMFSRNSSSSRAIPVKKQIQKVLDDDVYPLHWGVDRPGMIANEEHDPVAIETLKFYWDNARTDAVNAARALMNSKGHKQLVNRVLEPFSTITTIITATDFRNFYLQRCHPAAQPEIQALAIAMMEAQQESMPVELDWGEWHLPFIKPEDLEQGYATESLIRISTGRSARVSYLTHEGVRDPSKDIDLYNRLTSETPPHLSPLEHPAKAEKGQWANFTGWQSRRFQFELGQKGVTP